MNRKKNVWVVQLQANTGAVSDYTLESNWDRERDNIGELVASAAAIQAWYESGKKVEYQPVAAPVLQASP